MNIILVIIDTLRKDHVGCYGNDWIRTPNLDRLAEEGVRFTHAYPESLPALPARRAIHTGQRVFPARDHRPLKGDFRRAPGWGPIREEQDTLAELLREAGYRTALITDSYQQFKPTRNFHRGFDEWQWIRGQEGDAYRSGPLPGLDVVFRHMPEHLRDRLWIGESLITFHQHYLANVAERKGEEDYFAPRVFREAANWLRRNRDAERFFLVVDSFDSHEPWDPPARYRRLYEPDGAEGDAEPVDVICSLYGPSNLLTDRELKRVRANYAGEVTLVDTWLGHFLEQVDILGLRENTLLIVVSDHGHCLGEQGLLAKQGYPMPPAVADVALLMRHPTGEGAGTTVSEFVTHADLAPTILAHAGVEPRAPMDGEDLWPLVRGTGGPRRDHVTVGWGAFVVVRDREYWYNAYAWGDLPLLYDLTNDPKLENNLAPAHPDICEKMKQIALRDAGGDIPDYLRRLAAEGARGCTPLGQMRPGA